MVAASATARPLLNLSQSWQAMAWHAYDYGEVADALSAAEKAVQSAQGAEQAGGGIEMRHNHRIVLNQQAFILIQENQVDAAAVALEKAVALGQQLQAQAPLNREYQREFAYSLTTAGEAAERLDQLDQALAYYRQALAISRDIAEDSASGFSAANDLAVDLLSVGNVLARQGERDQAVAFWQQALDVMTPVVASEPDNRYYLYTQAVALIRLGHHQRAQPLVDALVEADMVDGPFQALLDEYGLQASDGTGSTDT